MRCHRPIFTTVLAAGALSLLVAACGASSPTPSTTASPGDKATIVQLQQAGVDFSRCMRSHGMPSFPDPASVTGGLKFLISPNSPERNSPAFQSAATACQHLLPGGGPGQREVHSPAQIASFVAFAHCIRGHGFPSFPDPTRSGQLTHEMLASAGINLQLPAVVQAADACVSVTHGAITKADVARFAAGR